MTRYDDADLIIVDGRNTLFRSAYSNRKLGFEDDDGWQPTGGVYGFIESILSVAHRAKHAAIVIAWEGSKENRRAIVPEYKVRKDDPKALELVKLVISQEAILRKVLRRSAWDSARAPLWEADDVMGTIARVAREQGDNVAIYSTDADMLQLLREPDTCSECGSDKIEEWGESGEFWLHCHGCGCDDVEVGGWIRQIKPTKGLNVVWDSARVVEEWGVTPARVVDVKALSGDTSDCYRGCPGIGDLWAQRIVAEYGTVPEVLEVAEKTGEILGSKKKAEAIVKNRAYILACYDVAKINTRAPTKYTAGIPNRDRLDRSLAQLRFHSVRSAHHMKRMLK